MLSHQSWSVVKKMCKKSNNGLFQTFLHTKSRIAYPPGMVAYEDDYTTEPIYPPIDPETVRFSDRRRNRLQKSLDWQNGMLEKPTVEEKLMELNMPRKYGWFCTVVSDNELSYDSWEFIKFITRTHLVTGDEKIKSTAGHAQGSNEINQNVSHDLPDQYYSPELLKKVEHFKQKLKGMLQDVLKFEQSGISREFSVVDQPGQIEYKKTISVVNQLSRLIVQVLGPEVEYLNRAQIDRDAKIEAFWMLGGFERTEVMRKMLKNLKSYAKVFCQVKEDDHIERNIQYDGTNIFQIRSEFPLCSFREELLYKDLENLDSFNAFPHMPGNYGFNTRLRFATNNPGHWSGCQARSNLLSMHSTHHLLGTGNYRDHKARMENPSWRARIPSLLAAQGVLVSFAKLVAQAYSLGFNQFCDLQYPLSSQTILTNGWDWSFYAYQLNTFKLDRRNLNKNKKMNLCWRTQPMRILNDDGQLNDKVVENLLKFFLLPTMVDQSRRFDTPFIKQHLNDEQDEIKREFIYENFKDMYSQKKYQGTYDLLPEIYQWEKFYKIDNKTMPADPRRRFFELPTSMGPKPYDEPYQFRNTRKRTKMLVKYMAELELKKEAERIAAAKLAEKAKYIIDDDPDAGKSS